MEDARPGHDPPGGGKRGVSVAVAVGVAGEPGMCPAGFGRLERGTLRAERERENTHFYYCTS